MNMNRVVLAVMTIALLIGMSPAVFAGTIEGKVSATGAPTAANAVIYVEPNDTTTYPAPKEHALMDQKDMHFVPHILPILVNTTVDFRNSDDVQHNVFAPDKCAGSFNLGTWGKGEVRSHKFTQADCFAVILCNIHPEMEAFVAVLPTPYFAVSDSSGGYSIPDVPAGKYTVKIWHESLKGKEMEVMVPAKGEVTADFQIHR